MASKFAAVVLATGLPLLRSAEVLASDLETSSANPVRKVVTMLQTMSKKVQEEGEKEDALMAKFTCYCKNGKGDLANSIAAADVKNPALISDIEEAQGAKTQLDADLKSHRTDREAAKASMAEATALRGKAAAAFAASKAEHSSNIAAISKAVAALEKGMAGSFLQTTTAKVIQSIVEAGSMNEYDRQIVLSFLSGKQDAAAESLYSPKSGQITGLLKQLGDDMSKSLADETAQENASIGDHAALMSAKGKEVAAHTQAIEEKSVRVGETAVHIVQMKDDLTDTEEALLNDRRFLKELEQGCDTKAAEWAVRQQTRSDELVALAETVKVLNDDDALELFKSAVPSAAASLVQLSGSARRMQVRALELLRAARGAATGPGIDFITLALQGKSNGFEKVQKMIEEMVANLKKEQQDDDNKKEFCATQLDLADDKKTGLKTTSSDAATAIANAEEGIAAVKDEIKALTDGIVELDKSVASATDQRKQEHVEFTGNQALDSQAKDLLGVAKNRLNKFYSPKLYIAPVKTLTAKEVAYQSVVEPAFVQVAAHAARGVEAPAPPPETFGAYSKKSQENTGVVAMIDLIIKDLDKEMTEAETNEKESQKDYEVMMADAKSKRASDSKALGEKVSTKANLESEAQAHNDVKDSATKELAAHSEYVHGLHAECDWLVEHHQVRKDARASEVDSLNNAKAVLAGSDYSLVQTSRHGFLRGA